MADVVIYTTKMCPYCVAAKELFRNKEIAYQEIDLTDDPEELKKLKTKTGMRTVPQIFINGIFIGGCEELYKLNNNGKLDSLLAR